MLIIDNVKLKHKNKNELALPKLELEFDNIKYIFVIIIISYVNTLENKCLSTCVCIWMNMSIVLTKVIITKASLIHSFIHPFISHLV